MELITHPLASSIRWPQSKDWLVNGEQGERSLRASKATGWQIMCRER